jgi:hypothetical protein
MRVTSAEGGSKPACAQAHRPWLLIPGRQPAQSARILLRRWAVAQGCQPGASPHLVDRPRGQIQGGVG